MNNKATIITVCVCGILLSFVISFTRGCDSKNNTKIDKNNTFTPKTSESNEKIKNRDTNYTSYSNSYSSPVVSSSGNDDSGNPPSLLSEKQKEKLKKSYEKDKIIIATLKKEWMENKLKDPNLSPTAIEQFKLRSNSSFVNGMKAFENKDYDQAILFFNEILKDPNASPVSKYFACMKLMDVAMKKKDIDLYFIAARARAMLENKEDLSILGVQKNDYTMEWLDKLEYSLRAKNDPKYFDKCVELKLAENKIKKDIKSEDLAIELELAKKKGITQEKKRERAIERVKKDIEFYSDKYKELIE